MGMGSSSAGLTVLVRKADNCASYLHNFNEKQSKNDFEHCAKKVLVFPFGEDGEHLENAL